MKDLEILSDLTQIKAISHGYRIRILEAFGEKAASAKQISDLLGEPHAKVNYHIKVLVRVGILAPAGENVRLGVLEKYYQAVARHFRIDSGAMQMSDARVKASVDHASLAAFEHTSRQFFQALERKDRTEANRISTYPDLHLTETQAHAFFKEYDALLQAYAQRCAEPGQDTRRYYAGLILVPSGK